jgi:Domain of unknown function (DUF397)
MEGVDPRWRKASYSGNGGGSCVEVGNGDSEVLVRDTKNHGRGPVLRVTRDDWRRFLKSIRSA